MQKSLKKGPATVVFAAPSPGTQGPPCFFLLLDFLFSFFVVSLDHASIFSFQVCQGVPINGH